MKDTHPETIIEIDNLTHRFADGTTGLQNVSLTIETGSFVAVAGANGSGKTTLLRHLNGLLLPTSGIVRVAGLRVGKDLARTRQTVGMVFQDADTQIVGETVYEDVAFGPENLSLDRAEVDRRVSEALDAGGLSSLADRQPHLLSSGEKRRLAIAGILAMNPRVIVLDEPFSNLDFPGLNQVLQEITSLHRTGHTIVMSTHDLEPVIGRIDRLIIMKDGRVAADGRPLALVDAMDAFGIRTPCWLRTAGEASR